MAEVKKASRRKIAVIVLVVAAVTALVATAAVLMVHRLNGSTPRLDDPLLVKSQSAYVQYEIRNNAIYLYYDITLKNPSDKEMSGFSVKGVFDKDYESGFILDKNAPSIEKLTGAKTFSIAAGETKTYHLIFAASYFRNQNSPSMSLPSVVLTTADGREATLSETE